MIPHYLLSFHRREGTEPLKEVFSVAGNYRYLNKVSELDVSKDDGQPKIICIAISF